MKAHIRHIYHLCRKANLEKQNWREGLFCDLPSVQPREMSESASDIHYAHAVNTALEAIKSLLLVNGGAATALIALKTTAEVNFGLPVLLFGLAALLNAFTLIIGYFSQLNYANARAAYEAGHAKEANSAMLRHGKCQNIAIAVVIISLASSAAGMFMAFIAV